MKDKTQNPPLRKFLMQFHLEQASPIVVFKKLLSEIEILKGELDSKKEIEMDG